ncbi:shikimate dehydrogenase [Hoeflea sp. IMCC20628]|uniref:shikimate dehydrogenase n=1 Tax=Hoeflea sp. IMCC20628 TaxID=1620421 RepID=UPI00063AB52B|nr:shikimate dehydrogenase [Hoeflea sp. IMCC20628]AKI02902.1 shikimate dehydrogenase [Hoeflea sp. IMCC20628]
MDKDIQNSSRAFVIGHPIGHSRSPMIHRYWLNQAGLTGSYDPVDVAPEDLPTFFRALKDRSSGFTGGNVTVPHKEAIITLVDEIDETARLIGAANTVWLEDGRLMATNTDSLGFAANLDETAAGWDHGKRAIVLGAGGASRAVVHALLARGFDEVSVVNRTASRASTLAERFGPCVSAHGLENLADVIKGANLFVNTTTLGMAGTEVPPIDFTTMASDALVTDIVYIPLETPILAMAKHQGVATTDGLGMLLHQAAPGFQKWFGVKPVVTPELRQLIISDMEAH